MIYLDNAATSYYKPECVIKSMINSTISMSANAGRGGHKLSIKAMDMIYNATASVAELFGIDNPENIAYTQNATLALNMAIGGILDKGHHAVVTQMEHNSVLRPVNYYGNYTVVKADKNGYVNPLDIEKAITPDTSLIVCTHASNVCGSIQPVKEISMVAKKYNIPFLLDAAQTAGCYPLNIKEIGADMFAFSGHKGLMGPLGTGGLYVSDRIKLKSVISGGTGSNSESIIQPDFMPDMLHSGTLNTPGIIALGEACRFIMHETPSAIHEKEKYLANVFIEDISCIKGITVYGDVAGKKLNGTVAFNINGVSSTAVSEYLDKNYNIITRAGFHCAPLAHKSLDTGGNGCVRVSFGYFNDLKDEKILAEALKNKAK